MQEETIAFLDDTAWGSYIYPNEGKRACLSLSLARSLAPSLPPLSLSLSLSLSVSVSDLTSTQGKL